MNIAKVVTHIAGARGRVYQRLPHSGRAGGPRLGVVRKDELTLNDRRRHIESGRAGAHRVDDPFEESGVAELACVLDELFLDFDWIDTIPPMPNLYFAR